MLGALSSRASEPPDVPLTVGLIKPLPAQLILDNVTRPHPFKLVSFFSGSHPIIVSNGFSTEGLIAFWQSMNA